MQNLRERVKTFESIDLNLVSNILREDYTDTDLTNLSVNKKFIQLFNLEQLNTLFSNMDNQKFLTSCIFEAIHAKPIEFANSAFFDTAFNNHGVLCELDKERVKTALLNGKNKEVLNYLYTDFPEKQLKKYTQQKAVNTYIDEFSKIQDYFYDQSGKIQYRDEVVEDNTQSYLYENLRHFAIPTQKTLKSISAAYEALVDIKVNNICHALNQFYNNPRHPDFDYRLDVQCFNVSSSAFSFIECAEPQTEEGIQVKAEMLYKAFFDDNKHRYQYAFIMADGKFHSNTDNEELNQHLDYMFNFEKLSLDKTIEIYAGICEQYKYIDPIIDYTEQLLDMANKVKPENIQTIYNNCIFSLYHNIKDQADHEVLKIVQHPNFIPVFEKTSAFNVNFNQLIEINDKELIAETFLPLFDPYGEGYMEVDQDYFDDINKKLNIETEKKEMRIKLANF